MKLLKTNNREIIRSCEEQYCFKLPSDLLVERSEN